MNRYGQVGTSMNWVLKSNNLIGFKLRKIFCSNATSYDLSKDLYMTWHECHGRFAHLTPLPRDGSGSISVFHGYGSSNFRPDGSGSDLGPGPTRIQIRLPVL